MIAKKYSDTIFSLSTPVGTGALAIIRISGTEATHLLKELTKRKKTDSKPNQVRLYRLYAQDNLLDEALVSVFKGPHSFTREDMLEISCHNSAYIIQAISIELTRLGARQATPGEFTQRAFLNGRFDLAQAEAIADLIASDNKAAHQVAMNQMRGGISSEIKNLRSQLIEFAALIELELDFSEEDVEFANREALRALVIRMKSVIVPLIQSFSFGNSLKNGIPLVIAGKPNAGKSTLLNILLNEERAIVSEIPGTTRDTIEEEFTINGIKFRLIDTAGLRDTLDTVEALGVKKTKQKLKEASVILYVIEASLTSPTLLSEQINQIKSLNIPYILVGNKLDIVSIDNKNQLDRLADVTWISAAKGINIDTLKQQILDQVKARQIDNNSTIVTNTRHYQHLNRTLEALERIVSNLDNHVSSEWIALDIRDALRELGSITGEITNDEILSNIFTKFCIGK